MLLIFLHIVYVVGAIWCILIPFDKSRSREPWSRLTFWIVSVIFLILGLGGFAEDLHLRAYHILSGIRGFGIGLLFVLLVSGQFGGAEKFIDGLRRSQTIVLPVLW